MELHVGGAVMACVSQNTQPLALLTGLGNTYATRPRRVHHSWWRCHRNSNGIATGIGNWIGKYRVYKEAGLPVI